MRDWFVMWEDPEGKWKRERVRAATVAGAVAKFMEMHTEIDGGAITSVFLAKLREEDIQGMGLPTGPPPC